MKTILILVILFVLFKIGKKILHPRNNMKLLKSTMKLRDNLESYFRTIEGEKISIENSQVLASMIYLYSYSSKEQGYHYRKNFKALKELRKLKNDDIKQAKIISTLKKYILSQNEGEVISSYNKENIMNSYVDRCFQLVSPSASSYGI